VCRSLEKGRRHKKKVEQQQQQQQQQKMRSTCIRGREGLKQSTISQQEIEVWKNKEYGQPKDKQGVLEGTRCHSMGCMSGATHITHTRKGKEQHAV